MRVALTGARGQLGYDIQRTKPEKILLLPVAREQADITERDRLYSALAELKPDVVINAAAYVRVDDAENETAQAFNVNAAGVRNLCSVCSDLGSILVHIGTDYVYDGKRSGVPYTEFDMPNPINAYGVTKYAGDLFVMNYLERYYLLRSASLYGKAGASGKGGNFVYTMLRKAKAGETIRVVDDVVMSPTPTYDLAIEIWRFLTEERDFGLYHTVSGGWCSWHEFTTRILALSGIAGAVIPIRRDDYPAIAVRPRWSALTSAKGIVMRDWESALRGFLDEVRQSS